MSPMTPIFDDVSDIDLETRKHLKVLISEANGPITYGQYSAYRTNHAPHLPSGMRLVRTSGKSWQEILTAMGAPKYLLPPTLEEAALQSLCTVANVLGDDFTSMEYEEVRRSVADNTMSAGMVRKMLGSWKLAMKALHEHQLKAALADRILHARIGLSVTEEISSAKDEEKGSRSLPDLPIRRV